jgi:hypothetical protein
MGSDNPSSAGNQQERPISSDWVVGFVDGEGCFSIGFVRQSDRAGRKGYRAGYQVFHRFVVTQGARSATCLEELKEFFGVGRLFVNRRHDNHKEDLHQFIVGRRADLLETVIPFFREFPLRTAKQADFERFALCLELVAAGEHLTRGGLVQIAEIAQTMNHQKPRRELIRILRGHTPDVRDTGR